MSSAIRGIDCKLSIDGTEVVSIRDVDVDRSAEELDATQRGTFGSAKWREVLPGTKSWQFTASLRRDRDDPVQSILKSAFNSGTKLSVRFTEPTGDDQWTEEGDAYVMSFRKTEPREDVVQLDLTIVGSGALSNAS